VTILLMSAKWSVIEASFRFQPHKKGEADVSHDCAHGFTFPAAARMAAAILRET
jgi:hypothetical protein